MIINAWLGVKDGFQDEVRAAIEAEDYDGQIARDILDLFRRSVDHSTVLTLFQKNSQWTLWSIYFQFDDDDEFEYPTIDMPPEPDYPEWTGGPRPEYPVEPIPVDENGEPLMSREEWEATPEFAAWEQLVDEWRVADREWSDLYKQFQKDYEAVDKPHRKEIAKRKGDVRKLGRAFKKTNDTIIKALTDLPSDLKLLGAWFWDGAQAMPLDNQLLKYMPDVFDGFKPNGDPKYKQATELTDVNLVAGQAPRDFTP